MGESVEVEIHINIHKPAEGLLTPGIILYLDQVDVVVSLSVVIVILFLYLGKERETLFAGNVSE